MIEGEKLIPINIEDEMKSAYIDYSMSVIVSRALPDVRDGLKPVHRRVLFGMHELGVRASSAHKKSAKAEDRLQEMMTELEQGNSSEKSSLPENSRREEEDKLTAKETSAGQEFKKIFTSKKQFKEFVQFIKNGFKR